jgi:hypothetical protein
MSALSQACTQARKSDFHGLFFNLLFHSRQNVTPLISNVKGGRSARWQSYEQAYDSFMMDLHLGHIVQDTTVIIRTQIVEE